MCPISFERRMEKSLVITDGGIETHMIYLLKRELKNFALFECLLDDKGLSLLNEMYESYLAVARKYNYAIIIGSPTWRANLDHMESMGYNGKQDVKRINQQGVEFMLKFREENGAGVDFTVAGDIGPRGDGYKVGGKMTVEESQSYHATNIAGLVQGGAELIQALTMNYWEEAAGIVLAAKTAGIPAVIMFTVETDGNLVTGMSFKDAIQRVDTVTEKYALYFGCNCAHPIHCEPSLKMLDEDTLARVKQIRVNASKCSHEEIDQATELDYGDIEELGRECAEMKEKYSLTILGGCCGTDHRHIESMAKHVHEKKAVRHIM